jgi:hypothetical protein
MGSKYKPKKREIESDLYDDDYFDEFDDFDDVSNFKQLSKDFYSTDWHDPSDSDRRITARRKIERRRDLRDLYAQFDDGEELDLGNEW